MRPLNLALLLVLAAVACGPSVVPFDQTGTDTDASDGGDTIGPADDAGLEDGGLDDDGLDDDTGSDDDGSGDDGLDGDSTDDGPIAVPGHCGVATDEVVGVIVDSADATLVWGDGTTEALVSASEAPARTYSGVAEVAASGIAVIFRWSVFDGMVEQGAELYAFDPQGVPRWSYVAQDASLSQAALGEDGSVTATLNQTDGDPVGVLFAADGTPNELPQFVPSGPLAADGTIPGREVTGFEFGTLGWYDTVSQSFVPLGLTPTSSWHLRRGDGFVYRIATELVIETRAGIETVDLGELANAPVYNGTGDWLLLQDVEAQQWGRVDLGSLQAEVIDLVPPAPFALLNCYQVGAAIDEQGRVIAPTRDSTIAQMQRFDPRDGSWTALGQPVTAIDAMHVESAGRSVLMRTDGQNMTFCPPQEFEPAGRGVHTDAQHHLVGAEDGSWRDLTFAEVVRLRSDGECVFYDDVGKQAVLLDTVADAQIDVVGGWISFAPQ